MEVANIFWNGELSTFEKKCIKSYVNNGFKVKLWSYDGIELDGCESCDANLVLGKSYIGKIQQSHPDISIERSNMAAFSDMFRFTLIAKHGGWWFDADCFCLKNQKDYKELRGDKDIIAFIEEIGSINCAAFYIKENSKVSIDILNEFSILYNENIDNVAKWGTFGPIFFTNFINKYGLNDCALDRDLAYAIHWEEFYLFFDATQKEIGHNRIKDSYLTHILNTFMKKHNVNKDEPPIGSLLDYLYQK
jgi:hypothetical protein